MSYDCDPTFEPPAELPPKFDSKSSSKLAVMLSKSKSSSNSKSKISRSSAAADEAAVVGCPVLEVEDDPILLLSVLIRRLLFDLPTWALDLGLGSDEVVDGERGDVEDGLGADLA